MHGRQMPHPLPAVIVARGCLYLGTEILTRPAPGVQATCPPLSCRRGAVVTCSRTIYPTAARLQVRACLVVLGTGMGGGCGRAALCAHGRAMPVTRLRVLRQMPHPVPAVCAVLMRGAEVRAPLHGRSGRELVGPGTSRMQAPLFVACGCPYSCSGIANSPCIARCWWEVSGPRSHPEAPADRVDEAIGSLPHRARLAEQDSSVQSNTH